MFAFGHLGIGSAIAKPFARRLRMRYVLLGTVLPDLIDKPLFYFLRSVVDVDAPETPISSLYLHVVRGTRSFGHTPLFWIPFALLAWKPGSPIARALALGGATHLLLDGLMELTKSRIVPDYFTNVLAWPFFGVGFPIYPFASAKSHLMSGTGSFTLAAELIGAVLLSREYLRWRTTRRVNKV